MKIPGILILVVVTVSCGSISYSTRPSQRVKEFVNLAVKQDYAGMRQMMPQGDEAEATLRGDSDLLLYAGTEGVKATEIEKETIAEPKATVDANITFSNAAQPLVYRFDLQKAGENWVVVRWERLTNSR